MTLKVSVNTQQQRNLVMKVVLIFCTVKLYNINADYVRSLSAPCATLIFKNLTRNKHFRVSFIEFLVLSSLCFQKIMDFWWRPLSSLEFSNFIFPDEEYFHWVWISVQLGIIQKTSTNVSQINLKLGREGVMGLAVQVQIVKFHNLFGWGSGTYYATTKKLARA
jgi:hypothetical protein